MVLTGTDALSAGIDQKLWIPVLPANAASLPKLDDIFLAGAERCRLSPRARASWSATIPSGPLLEYMPDKVKKAPTTADELLAWTKREQEQVPLCPPGQFRPRPHLHDGPALHPRRFRSEGPDEGLGQDLGLSQGARREHRVLSDRHRRDHEGARRRHPRHHRLDDGLGHQPARPRHRAEGGEDRHAQGLPLGHGRPLHVHPEGRAGRQARGAARPDELPAHARSSRPTPTTRAISIPAPP